MQVPYLGDVIDTILGMIMHISNNKRKAKSALDSLGLLQGRTSTQQTGAIGAGKSPEQTAMWASSVFSNRRHTNCKHEPSPVSSSTYYPLGNLESIWQGYPLLAGRYEYAANLLPPRDLII